VVVIDRGGRPLGLVTGGDLIALIAHHVPETEDPDQELTQDQEEDST